MSPMSFLQACYYEFMIARISTGSVFVELNAARGQEADLIEARNLEIDQLSVFPNFTISRI